jgi:hypothetical protein
MAGSAVTITFASTLSMNIAHATIRGAIRAFWTAVMTAGCGKRPRAKGPLLHLYGADC